ncbi:hypothetical protein E3_0240 [Rhodococcus phage E3]|uniref:hypothetical protein n=1 Tax=Rhodococcus phage E3 TaxID=1007869 RepID=UPI0002C6962E|nr:hypothetical protein M176_gp025 [Rhodococcus phage E3]AEQ20935.1 hypothetical protein E3_0240 [Rhodococcus phage E3]
MTPEQREIYNLLRDVDFEGEVRTSYMYRAALRLHRAGYRRVPGEAQISRPIGAYTLMPLGPVPEGYEATYRVQITRLPQPAAGSVEDSSSGGVEV